MFDHPDFDGHERIVHAFDAESGLRAIVAIHNTALGPSFGGCRMWPYSSIALAERDVLRLSRAMTYKSAICGLPYGGGKSVILGDPKTMKTPELFKAMGRFVNRLEGQYITAEDMNIGVEDLEIVRTETKWVTGLSRAAGSSGNPSPYTARGCLVGLRAVLEETWGKADFKGKRFLIQGVGAVGGRLAVLLKKEGAVVVICDINEERVAQLKKEHGFESVPDKGHVDTPCDVYVPCARGAGLNDETIPRLKCKAVGGAANNQLLEPRHARDLMQRGILYAPDFVINAGGIINVSIELLPGGYNEDAANRHIDRIYDNLRKVFEISRKEKIPTSEAAVRLADERVMAARKAKKR